MAMFIRTPFAEGGDRTAIPNDPQPDGSVSYTSGFTLDYQGDYPTAPTAKPVPRLTMNEVLYDTTGAINQYQTHGFPDFITTADNGGTPFPYDIYAVVRYDAGSGVQLYQSIVNNNTSVPTDTTKWQLFPTTAAETLSVANTVGVTASIVPTVITFNQLRWTSGGMTFNATTHAISPNKIGFFSISALIYARFTAPSNSAYVNVNFQIWRNGALFENLGSKTVTSSFAFSFSAPNSYYKEIFNDSVLNSYKLYVFISSEGGSPFTLNAVVDVGSQFDMTFIGTPT